MASITSISTNVPKYSYSNADITDAGNIWLKDDPESASLFARFLESSQTENRNYVIPVEEVLKLNGTRKRSAIFEEIGPVLAEQAIKESLTKATLTPEELDVFIFTSCTCPAIPSIDGQLVHAVGLKNTIARIPLYQHGCAGGVIGLSLANQFANTGKKVLLSSVEFCSLIFQNENHSKGHLVGSAIFGDGTASLVISQEDKGLSIVDTQSYLIPNTRHLMGYDIMDNGSHLRLDKDLPQHLVNVVPELVKNFLIKNDLEQSDLKWWLFHPGGIKILNFLDEIFSLKPEQSKWSREVLRQNGNLSSSAILFVINNYLNNAPHQVGDYGIILGVGPGLTIELILFQMR